ncbi:phage holin family protein [Streptococcus pyogenes]|uniref:phage holin family protein n=1 Tax=Streptococcus pyogenes TaxID=1314 RepID=UPI00402AB1AC
MTNLKKGICRKVLIFAMVGVAHILDANVIGDGSVLRTAVIFFYISNEGVSLLENASHLGLPIPEKMKEILEQLHDRDNKESEGK